MIDTESMNDLFRLISRYLERDVTCYAFGGNAMMLYGYKAATKDIDIIFEDSESRDEFIRAIRTLGYDKTSPFRVYIPEMLKKRHYPLMFSRGDERFDIFLKQVFQTSLSDGMKERVFGRFDYTVKDNILTVFVLGKHEIILMKSVTQRERDFDDIRTIVEKDRSIDWGIVVDEAIWQASHGDKWILFDLEETMQRLRGYTLIKKKFFDRLHKAV